MISENEGLLSTGEFCKLCGITKDTLFYYEKLGILMPFLHKGNGYRYYSYSQLQDWFTISVLKNTGLSLEEIKSFLANKSHNNLIELLKVQSKKVDDRICGLRHIKAFIDHKVNSSAKISSINSEDIMIRNIETEKIIVSKKINYKDIKSISESLIDFLTYCKDSKIEITYEIGSIMNLEELSKPLENQYFQLFSKVLVLPKNKSRDIVQKPSGKYLKAYHKGSYFDTRPTYDRILNFAFENGFELLGCFYEVAIIDELSSLENQDFLIEISVRINV